MGAMNHGDGGEGDGAPDGPLTDGEESLCLTSAATFSGDVGRGGGETSPVSAAPPRHARVGQTG